jgi:DnaK suppressor protein
MTLQPIRFDMLALKCWGSAMNATAKKTGKSVSAGLTKIATDENVIDTQVTKKAAAAGKSAASKSAVSDKVDDLRSGHHTRSDEAEAGLQDKINKTVVLKVGEVATKPSKQSAAVTFDGALASEAQILSMGEQDYMNEAQLAFFKARLQQLERDLLKNAGETTEHLRETVLVPDPADRATIEEEHALELRTRDRERKLLKKVQQSIVSIDSGEYGWCEETGEPIGIPRLLARPTATLSLEAQQRREMKQKLYGD